MLIFRIPSYAKYGFCISSKIHFKMWQLYGKAEAQL